METYRSKPYFQAWHKAYNLMHVLLMLRFVKFNTHNDATNRIYEVRASIDLDSCGSRP